MSATIKKLKKKKKNSRKERAKWGKLTNGSCPVWLKQYLDTPLYKKRWEKSSLITFSSHSICWKKRTLVLHSAEMPGIRQLGHWWKDFRHSDQRADMNTFVNWSLGTKSYSQMNTCQPKCHSVLRMSSSNTDLSVQPVSSFQASIKIIHQDPNHTYCYCIQIDTTGIWVLLFMPRVHMKSALFKAKVKG